MKRIAVLFLLLSVSITLNSCGGKNTDHIANIDTKADLLSNSDSSAAAQSAQTDAATDAVKPEYPYQDTEGRMRYLMFINGKPVQLQHAPYSYPGNPKGAYYPIVEVLDYLNIDCLYDNSLMTLTTKVNGQIITCSANDKSIKVGKATMTGAAPEYVEDCFFVPSYVFMQLLNAVVDFNADRSGVTLTTAMVIDPATSGTGGLSISPAVVNNLGERHYSGSEACSTCGGTGKSICTLCSGTGYTTQYQQKYDPITHQLKIQSSRATCPRCSGSGKSPCSACGGSGHK